MTKTFCDSCGAELVRSENNAVKWSINQTRGKNGVVFDIRAGWNELGKGDVCDACVFDAVAAMARQEQSK